MKLTINKPDTIGAFASSLCLVHCIATPFLFLAQSCAITGCHTAPTWWKSIDFLFLAISFMAVYQSTKTTKNNLVKNGLWILWVALTFCIVNEYLTLLPVPEIIIYTVAISLSALHIYNLKFYRCKDHTCCTNTI